MMIGHRFQKGGF